MPRAATPFSLASLLLWVCAEVRLSTTQRTTALGLLALTGLLSGCSDGPPEPEARMHVPENLVGIEPLDVELSWQSVCRVWISHPTSSSCREQDFRVSFDCGELGCLVEKRIDADEIIPLDEEEVFEGSQRFRVTPSGFGELEMRATLTNVETNEVFEVPFNPVRVWDPAVLTLGVACDVEVDGSDEAGERPCRPSEDAAADGETIRTLYFSTTMTAADGTSFVARSLDYEVEGVEEVSGSSAASFQNDWRLALWLMDPGTLTFRTTYEGFGTRELTVAVR